MKLFFHGAAGFVTGSKHLIEMNDGTKILLDCGMSQGHGKDTDTMNRTWGFDPKSIGYVVLSHAHVDHSGLIPKLVKDGFEGKVFASPATVDLTEILLRNSAYIQEADIVFLNKRRRKENRPPLEPLYSESDARRAMELFVPVSTGFPFPIRSDISLSLYETGHIPGGSTVFLRIKEQGKITSIAFSGDVGRYGDPILKSPQPFPQADYIIVESTYGNKVHEQEASYAELLKQHIAETCLGKGGKLIIPAFSVGRTQELLFALNELEINGELPPVEYFVDSPLSTEATEVTKRHPECFNKGVIRLMKTDFDPFDFKGLRYIKSVDESKRLNEYNKPCVIISASGMAEAGRVKHHIANSIDRPQNTVLLVGYCEPESLGARLKQRPEQVKIFGDTFRVRADIREINSMSAHADYNGLSQYLACQYPDEVKQIFVVHGEPEVQSEFARRLERKGFRRVTIPSLHESFSLN
ncbi:MAG: MBL fold metallo-hydrolase [Prevotellaceae bacterium]|jgi:metallo-beta-lactamase family protein|nr:MBL fold metallo-hydrolase [Prevotellaceae bacterium]